MSAAATIAPVVLWSDQVQGNLYLAGKNTFLEFYTEENKALKHNAQARSASADGDSNRSRGAGDSPASFHLPRKASFQSSGATTADDDKSSVTCSGTEELATPLPHGRAWADTEDDDFNSPVVTPRAEYYQYAELGSPDTTPRHYIPYHGANVNGDDSTLDTTPRFNPQAPDSYPMAAMPMMPATPCVKQTVPERQPRVVAPPNKAGNAPKKAKQAKKQNLKLAPITVPVNEAKNEQMQVQTVSLFGALSLPGANENRAEVEEPPATQQRLAVIMAQLQAIRGLPGAEAEVARLEAEAAALVPPQPLNQTAVQVKPAKKQDQRKFSNAAFVPTEAAVATAPKKQNLKKLNTDSTVATGAAQTTVMIRGIPCSFSQESLLAVIDNSGLKGKYNFYYLPKDGAKSTNLGYAFVNFVDQQSAELCASTFTGVQLAPWRSPKTCRVVPATIQGIPSLKKHFCKTAVCHGADGPTFLKC